MGGGGVISRGVNPGVFVDGIIKQFEMQSFNVVRVWVFETKYSKQNT